MDFTAANEEHSGKRWLG